MIEEIKSKIETSSRGRNGIIKTKGIEVMKGCDGQTVYFSPLKRDGSVTEACFIHVGIDAIPGIIEALQAIINNQKQES